MYVAQPLDLRADYLDAVSIIVGLSLMLPKELGANNLFPKDEHTEAWHISVLGEALELRKAAAITPEDVFGYGMLCYYNRKQNEEQWSHVVKFKWRTSFKSKEEEIFKVVQENGITNVPSLVRHDRLGSTAELRDGLHHQAEPSGFPFRNHTCMCFVVTPIGLPLFTFRNSAELLVVLRDAIQAHRDVLQKANILHRDVSGSNILINQSTRRGMLINFDVAIDLSQHTPTARNIAGTLDYSAAGLLKENPYTYRHDGVIFLRFHPGSHAEGGPLTGEQPIYAVDGR
ncbi:hypothetical protein LMH87_001550 [Akanthomyces muscarius]|uniref:non-specific serine/threonine protein kinase n=1 Tax=Akanthomyces muscarius TaxID=2231603 RepID=A0A9W8Q5B9_AKAMU|nr:hypothetical protein LMH87_001550 [Akanthomyces muscarius]KAJ4146997.1 hypothetical protein LMH87_001550 [Akanthomyces muscarius]